jgi:hypothetical protein
LHDHESTFRLLRRIDKGAAPFAISEKREKRYIYSPLSDSAKGRPGIYRDIPDSVLLKPVLLAASDWFVTLY